MYSHTSECFQGRLFIALDAEQAVEPRDLEHLHDVRIDIAHKELAACLLNLLV